MLNKKKILASFVLFKRLLSPLLQQLADISLEKQFKRGEPFGEVPVFNGQPFPANAICVIIYSLS
jgi:hypothetical protein